MSMPIRNSSTPHFHAPVSDQRSVSPKKNLEHSNAHSRNTANRPALLHNNNTPILNNPALTGNAMLGQLFDMLERILKAMRELFSGKNSIIDATPDTAKQKTHVDTGKRPGRRTEVDMDKQPIMPDAGKMPTTPDLAGPKPPAPVPKPEVNVTKDANGNVEVKVTVNHCHCPDKKVSPDNDVRPRSVPDQPVASDVDDNVPEEPPAPLPYLPEIKPQSTVVPGDMPTPSSDASVPGNTSPGPAEHSIKPGDRNFNHRPAFNL